MNPGSLNPERDAEIYRKVKKEGMSVSAVAREMGLCNSRVQKIILRIENPKPPRFVPKKETGKAPKAITAPEWPSDPYRGEIRVIQGVTAFRPLRLSQGLARASMRSREAEPLLRSMGPSAAREVA